jgi:hypothetical protein
MKTPEMELALVEHFNPRVNLIVPNVHWGFGNYEKDLFIVTKAGYAYEIEIKVSKSDLKNDLRKRHRHLDYKNRIKHLYFAIPEKLKDSIHYVPTVAGIFIVKRQDQNRPTLRSKFMKHHCELIRAPKLLSKYKLTDKEQYQIARLGALRIWNLKAKLFKEDK